MKLILITSIALAFSTGALAGDIDFTKGCKTNPSLTGPCFKVHARLSVYNGTPSLRLWPIGTKRLLGVVNDEDDNILPKDITWAELNDGKSVYGDFEVCPFEDEKAGEMRAVCIESFLNYVVKPTR